MQLAEETYKLTETFPQEERFNLISQIRRCSVSILSNIAEGTMRGSRKGYRQFLLIAKGSVAELSTQLELSSRLKYITEDEFIYINSKIEEISKILTKIIKSLKTNN